MSPAATRVSELPELIAAGGLGGHPTGKDSSTARQGPLAGATAPITPAGPRNGIAHAVSTENLRAEECRCSGWCSQT